MLVSLLSAGNFVIGMGAFVIFGILSPMADGLGLSEAGAGQVLTVYALAYAVSSPLVVAATGRLSRRTVLAGGMALFGLAALGSALAPGAGALYAARALGALGAGVFTPVAASVAAAASPPEERGRALARVFFGLTLAQVLGVPVGSFLAYSLGWRSSFLAVAVLAAPCVAALLLLVPGRLAFQPTRLASLAATLSDWRTMLAVAFTMTYLVPIYVVYTFLAPLLETTMGFGRNGVTAAFLALGAGAVAGNLIGGVLSDRVGPGPTLVGLALVQVAVLPLFSTLPMPPALFFALAFGWASAGWSLIAPQQARLIRIAPDAQAVVLALNAAAIYLGAAGGSAAGGALIGPLGLEGLGVAAGAMALAGVANILFARAARPRDLPSTI
jgi:predicted MFS family arabinose efflux permease